MLSAPEKVLQFGFKERGYDIITGSIENDPPDSCDIIHCHHFGYASLQSSTLETPFVFTSHNPFIASNYHNRQFFFFSIMGRILLKRADFMVALSEMEKEIFHSRFGVPYERIRVIPNGIRPELYEARNEDLDADYSKFNLLYVAQLDRFKGIEYLLKAIKIIAVRYPDIRLDIISQNRRLLKEYVNICDNYGISKIVRFLGPLSMKDLIKAYQKCSIYIHPSLAEDLPTSISEAMMCGKPIIASQIAGIPNQIDENVGILIPPRDTNAIKESIIRLIKDPNLASSMGRRAKEKAIREFHYDVMCDRHIQVYKDAIQDSRRKRKRLENSLYRQIHKILRQIY